MKAELFISRLNVTLNAVEEAKKTEYGAWRDLAGFTVNGEGEEEGFGPDFIHFSMLSKKGARKITATRMTAHLKTVDPEGYKAGKETAKIIRELITKKSEERGLTNPRKLYADFLNYCVEEAGLTDKYPIDSGVKQSDGSKKAHIEFIGEAIRMLINHLNETEDHQCLELKELFPAIQEAAENDGVIKTD